MVAAVSYLRLQSQRKGIQAVNQFMKTVC